MEFALLVEAERLEGIAELDGRYHLAMMIAQGFNGGAQVVWDERNAWRSRLTSPSPTTTAPAMSREDHRALALDIERRLRAAGVIQH